MTSFLRSLRLRHRFVTVPSAFITQLAILAVMLGSFLACQSDKDQIAPLSNTRPANASARTTPSDPAIQELTLELKIQALRKNNILIHDNGMAELARSFARQAYMASFSLVFYSDGPRSFIQVKGPSEPQDVIKQILGNPGAASMLLNKKFKRVGIGNHEWDVHENNDASRPTYKKACWVIYLDERS